MNFIYQIPFSFRHYNLIYLKSISYSLDSFPAESFGSNVTADTLSIYTGSFTSNEVLSFHPDFIGQNLLENIKAFALSGRRGSRLHLLDLSLVLEGAENLNQLSVSSKPL